MFSELGYFVLFKLAYFTFVLIFSLLSTSAVVYATASTAKDAITVKKIMSVVPKVWKRLIMTFYCAITEFVCYTAVAVTCAVLLTWSLRFFTLEDRESTAVTYAGVLLTWFLNLWFFTLKDRESGAASSFVLIMIGILYVIGLVYLTLIWQLASVVTVLEDSYGEKARVKSKELIKGKMGLSLFIFLVIDVGFVLVWFLFNVVVMNTTAYGILILCFLLLSCLFLFALVLQTVLYFVCKSYHHESIDKSALADKDVQLEQYVR